jgi:hypothetical protein
MKKLFVAIILGLSTQAYAEWSHWQTVAIMPKAGQSVFFHEPINVNFQNPNGTVQYSPIHLYSKLDSIEQCNFRVRETRSSTAYINQPVIRYSIVNQVFTRNFENGKSIEFKFSENQNNVTNHIDVINKRFLILIMSDGSVGGFLNTYHHYFQALSIQQTPIPYLVELDGGQDVVYRLQKSCYTFKDGIENEEPVSKSETLSAE